MSKRLDVDVALIHIAGGAQRSTPPPGTIAQRAPRRAARNRQEDLLFLTLSLHAPQEVSPGLSDELAGLAAEIFFDTTGSATTALRAASAEVNQRLMNFNQDGSHIEHLQGRLIAAVLRKDELYIAQCGAGQILTIEGGDYTRHLSDDAANRPLGVTRAPYIRFHHMSLTQGERVIMSTEGSLLWSEPTLSGIAHVPTANAVEVLGGQTDVDATGIFLHYKPDIGHTAPPVAAAEVTTPESKPRVRASGAPARPKQSTAQPAQKRAPRRSLALILAPLQNMASNASETLSGQLSKLLVRLAPGMIEPPSPSSFSPGFLAATAIAVPLIVVAMTSVIYMRRGRTQQFDQYIAEANQSAAIALEQENPAEARALWQTTLRWLEAAETYGLSEDAELLRLEAQKALDSIDLVARVEFKPLITGGLGREANISALAASSTDLYLFDSTHESLWRAWSTGRGFEVDQSFRCLADIGASAGMSTPVDLAIQAEPGALGVEGVVAIDNDGTLVYCAPDESPATGQLTEPDTGWGMIQAIDVFNNQLMVLDPVANGIWIFDAEGGLFSGQPVLFFVEEVPDLSEAIDIAITQEDLFILYSDGHLDRCNRLTEEQPNGGVQIRTECDQGLRFEDDREGFEPQAVLPGAVPGAIAYSPPPEPSLYFLDLLGGGVYHYSMRMAYQGQFRPLVSIEGEISALALGPPNDLFLAAGDQVYFASATR